MIARILAQVAWVAMLDAAAIRDSYAWPPRELLDDERREAERLDVLGSRLMYRAACEGQTDAGMGALFGAQGEGR